MTDAELLAMIDERHPEDFTPAEIAALAEAARRSPRIAQECRDRIDLEQCLHHALGRPRIPVVPLFARAVRRASRPRLPGRWAALGGLLAVVALLAAIATARVSRRGGVAPATGGAPSPPAVETAETAGGRKAEAEAAAALPTAPPTEEPAAAAAAGIARGPAAEPPGIDAAAQAAAHRSPADLLFPPPPPPARGLSLRDANRWLERAPDRDGTLEAVQINQAPHVKLSGAHRLRPQLAPDRMLRIVVHDLEALRIQAWHGTAGAVFATRGWGGPWAAYALSRPADTARPTVVALRDRDDGRMRRTNPQRPMTIDVRHENGLLTLSRGDVRIVAAALAAAPTEVIVEGTAVVRELQSIPPLPLPAAAVRAIDAAGGAEQLPIGDAAAWIVSADQGGSFAAGADGRATLAAEANGRPIHALLPIDLAGPRAVVVRLEACDPGTGVVLGDESGRPRHQFAVVANQHDPSLRTLLPVQVGDNRLEGGPQPFDEPIAALGPQPWLRFVHCGGELKCDISADGTHWVRAVDPIPNVPPFRSIGLSAAAHASRRTIALARLETRGFGPLAAFPGFAALGGDCPRDRALEVLETIREESQRTSRTTDERLRLLDEIAALAPVWRGPADAARLAAGYAEIGRLASGAGERPYSQIALRQQTSPLACRDPFEFFPVGLARDEFCELLVAGRWNDLHALARRAEFFNLPGTPPLFAWAAQATADGRLADAAQPLVLEPTKSGATIEADLRTALAEDDMARACEVIAAAADEGVGLVPAPGDADLFADIPALATWLMRAEPRFAAAIREHLGPRARLRLRRAVETGDAELLENVTNHAPGTAASGEAHRLLGDRALAAGRFALARRHYRAALECGDPEIAAGTAPGARLATPLDQAAAAASAPQPAVPEGWAACSATVFIDGVLHACLAAKERDEWVVVLGAFSPATGDLRHTRPLVRLRAVAGEAAPACLLGRIDESLVVLCAGGLVCCDPEGHVRWMRRQAFVPPAIDPLWKSQPLAPPLAADGTLFVVQPGAPAILAVDAGSGRVVWKRGCDGARRVLGVNESPGGRVVLVETAAGTAAFRAADGRREPPPERSPVPGT